MSSGGQNKKDAGPTFHVTILRSKSNGQMIYVEAEKDLVDVLLSFLVLPVGTIMRMLDAGGLVNSTSSNLRFSEVIERNSLIIFVCEVEKVCTFKCQV